VRREVASSGAWVAGAGITGIIGYLIATASAGGAHPNWPYIIFSILVAAGIFAYVASRQVHDGRRSGEIIVYSSEKSKLLGHDFTGKGAQTWNGKEHVGAEARGELSFVGGLQKTINLLRTNNDGKYLLGLRRYSYQERTSDVLPGNFAIPGERRLRVSGEAKITGSPHRLILRWNPPKDGYRLAEKEIVVDSSSWTRFDEYFQVDPTKDCYLRINDYYQMGPTPSALQIRRITVREESAEQ
jgi:hypothetical protein